MHEARRFLVIGLSVLASAATAADTSQVIQDHRPGNSSFRPVGAWLLTVTYPDFVGIPPFQETLVLHHGGTVSETNGLLHGNSANPAFPFNGGDGYGSWHRAGGRNVAFRFTKLLYDGVTNQHVGYLRVTGTLRIVGDTASQQDPADASVTLFVCGDVTQYPDTCAADPFPPPTAVGRRL